MDRIFLVVALTTACGGGKAPPPASNAPPTIATAATPAAAPASKSPLPDTAAGKALGAWLDAFNSGDEARISTFVADHKYPKPAGLLVQFRQQTGGFELVRVEKTEPLAIRFVVQEKASPTTAVGWLRVKDGARIEIESFEIFAIPPGMTSEQINIEVDAATRARVIDAAVAKLTEHYVFPEVAKKMAEALREHQKTGAYESIREAPAFAKRLTDDLRAVSKDLHLGVQFTPKPLPEGDPEPSAEAKAQKRKFLENVNCGFKTAERLDGNLGYIKLDMFGDAEICAPKATAAFAALGDVDALIFDLRDNGGGHPEMVAFVSSYLFGKRTHLNDIYDRKQDKTTQHWTKPDVPGKKYPKQPVFVLTSKKTFSGAEEFSYNLKNLKRATIIGETTGGGAHPTSGHRLDAHFKIGVPSARAINPITKTNWEGKGVEPDVKVPAADALDTAKKLAAERLAKKKRG